MQILSSFCECFGWEPGWWFTACPTYFCSGRDVAQRRNGRAATLDGFLMEEMMIACSNFMTIEKMPFVRLKSGLLETAKINICFFLDAFWVLLVFEGNFWSTSPLAETRLTVLRRQSILTELQREGCEDTRMLNSPRSPFECVEFLTVAEWYQSCRGRPWGSGPAPMHDLDL